MAVSKEEELRKKSSEIKASYKKALATRKENISKAFDNDQQDLANILFQEIDWIGQILHERLDFVENELFAFIAKHTKNHPPHPKTPSQMKRALEAFNMQDDVEVEKEVVRILAKKKQNLNDFLKNNL